MKKVLSLLLTMLLILGLAIPSLAADMVPSIEAKPAPELITITDPDGREAQAVIIAEDGTKTYVYPDDILELVITPLSGKEHAVLTEIKDMLIKAEYEVRTAETVADLTQDMYDVLEDYKARSTDPLIKEINIDDLCVTDIFDISLVYNGIRIFDVPEGCNVQIKLQTNLDPNRMFFVLSDCYGNGWNVVNDSCWLDENGVLTLTRDALCPFVLIGYKRDVMEDDPGDDPGKKPDDDDPGKKPDDDKPHSPQTGTDFETIEAVYAISGLVFAAGAVICFRKARHKVEE